MHKKLLSERRVSMSTGNIETNIIITCQNTTITHHALRPDVRHC